MGAWGSLATLSLVVGISGAEGGCAAQGGPADWSQDTPAMDQPLDITVDSLDVVHGALRLSATMVDGAAEVSVRLGGDCEHREVGGGLSTPSSLVWALGDREVAQAIGCGLVVRALARDGAGYANKVADLAVTVDTAAPASESPDDGPRLQTVTVSQTGVELVFSSVVHGARLITSDSLVEATPSEPNNDDPAPGEEIGRFLVPRIDFARAILRGRPLSLEGLSFAPSLSVGGMSLQGEAPQQSEETAPEEVDDER